MRRPCGAGHTENHDVFDRPETSCAHAFPASCIPMRFVDEAVVDVEAGKGGDGHLSFHRARNVPRGRPDGGNGGEGGSVVLVGDAALNTLVDFRFNRVFRADAGASGGGNERTGAAGKTLCVAVPVGTTVVDDASLELVGDLTEAEQTLTVAAGGGRGLGNAHFKSGSNRSPRRTTSGRPGEVRRLRLQLKVMADVGLLGAPNAGKSTLISRMSAAKPRIADYPFTTLTPNLGVVRVGPGASFLMADVPGLIAGAAQGAGLGVRFLRHLTRTRLLAHLVDIAPLDGSDPAQTVAAIEAELYAFSEAFRQRDIFLVATKTDLVADDSALQRLRQAFPHRRMFAVSAAQGEGLDELAQALMVEVEALQQRLVDDDEFALQDRRIMEAMRADVLAGAETRQHVSAGDWDDDE